LEFEIGLLKIRECEQRYKLKKCKKHELNLLFNLKHMTELKLIEVILFFYSKEKTLNNKKYFIHEVKTRCKIPLNKYDR
jgi:hypothetical protein